MKTHTGAENQIHNRFVSLARELDRIFPALDLRFNLKSGSTQVRVLSRLNVRPLELDLARSSETELIHTAIFAIKEQARLFDA